MRRIFYYWNLLCSSMLHIHTMCARFHSGSPGKSSMVWEFRVWKASFADAVKLPCLSCAQTRKLCWQSSRQVHLSLSKTTFVTCEGTTPLHCVLHGESELMSLFATSSQVFIYDPLYKWALSPLKALERQQVCSRILLFHSLWTVVCKLWSPALQGYSWGSNCSCAD